MRKTIYIALAALWLLAGTALAQEMAVTVDGEALEGRAFVREGVTYAPLAPLLEALGGWTATWNGEEGTAWAETALFRLAVPLGADHLLADGFAFPLPAAVLAWEGEVYIPLRAAANLLGAGVEFSGWDRPVAVTAPRPEAYSQEDLYWLSRVISAESRGEPLAGQIAVGNVVRNRVASPKFPNTIHAVVFDRQWAVQFEPVSNGTIYNAPTAQSVLAARLALNGTDMVGDCLYFFAPALSPGTWIRENAEYHTTIGCHQFYR